MNKFLLECEARFWIDYARKNGRLAWIRKRDKIEKRRGKEAVKILLTEMNRQRKLKNK